MGRGWRSTVLSRPITQPLDLFEDVASPEDFEVAIEYEMITSDRATDELGRILALAPEERLL